MKEILSEMDSETNFNRNNKCLPSLFDIDGRNSQVTYKPNDAHAIQSGNTYLSSKFLEMKQRKYMPESEIALIPSVSLLPEKRVNLKSVVNKVKLALRAGNTTNNRRGGGDGEQELFQNQSIMRRTYNKISGQLKIRRFVQNMLALLARQRREIFSSKRLFFQQFNDKAAFFSKKYATNHIDLTHPGAKQDLNGKEQNPPPRNFFPDYLLRSFFNQQRNIYSRQNKKIRFWKCIERIPIFSPFSNFLIMWDSFQLMFLSFFFITIPIQLSFNLSIEDLEGTLFVRLLLIFLIALDMVVTLNTGLFSQGREINNRVEISIAYWNNGFSWDAITLLSLLFCIALNSIRGGGFASFLLILLFLIFFKRYQQFGRVLKKIEIQQHFSPLISQILRLANLFVMNIYIIHLLACGWIFIALWQNNYEPSNSTWLNKLNLENDSWHIQFLNSFYFNTVTMVTVGYGDISPQTNFERFFSILTVLFACCFFAYSISEVGSIFQEMNEGQKRLKADMYVINNYMKKKRITSDLQYQIRHYLEYYWHESLTENSVIEQNIINQLSNNLKENLFIEANRLLVLESPFFRDNFSLKTILKTVSIVFEQRCTPEEIIYLEGDIDDCSIYFIEKGSVQTFHSSSLSPNIVDSQPNPLNTLRRGEYFGEYCFLTGKQRLQSLRSLEFTTLIKIDRKLFIDILAENQQDLEKFCLIRDEIIFNQNLNQIQKQCLYCRHSDQNRDLAHMEQACPLMHFIPNRQRLEDQFNLPSSEQKRLPSGQRKVLKINALARIEQVSGDSSKFFFSARNIINSYLQTNGLLKLIQENGEEESESDLPDSQLSSGLESSDERSSNSNSFSSSSCSLFSLEEQQSPPLQVVKEESSCCTSQLPKLDAQLSPPVDEQTNRDNFPNITAQLGHSRKPKLKKSWSEVCNELSSMDENLLQTRTTEINKVQFFPANLIKRKGDEAETMSSLSKSLIWPTLNPININDIQVESIEISPGDISQSDEKKLLSSHQQQQDTFPGEKKGTDRNISQKKHENKRQLFKKSIIPLEVKKITANLQENRQHERKGHPRVTKMRKSTSNYATKYRNSVPNHFNSRMKSSDSVVSPLKNKKDKLLYTPQANELQNIDNLGGSNRMNLSKSRERYVRDLEMTALRSVSSIQKANSILENIIDKIKERQVQFFDKDEQLNYNQPEENKFPKNDESFQLQEFERMRIWEVYFPHNNYDVVINALASQPYSSQKKGSRHIKSQPYLRLSAQSTNNLPPTSYNQQQQQGITLNEIFQQNPLNRLKFLRNTKRRENSITESQLSIPQANPPDPNRQSYKDKIPQKNIEETNSFNFSQKSQNFIQTIPVVEPYFPGQSLPIPNYFGIGVISEKSNITHEPHPVSKFKGRQGSSASIFKKRLNQENNNPDQDLSQSTPSMDRSSSIIKDKDPL